MKNYTLGAVVLFTALCIGSCTDYDYGFSEKSIQYDESFKSAFGEIDPNQDWIMATRVRADINLSNIPGSYKLNILTGNPANSNTRLLAQTTVVDGQASLNFDCIKGLDKVYITASKDGKYAICKEYPIVEGQLLVGNVTRGVVTRADGAPTCEAYSNSVDGKVTYNGVTANDNSTGTVPYPIVWCEWASSNNHMETSDKFDWPLYKSSEMTRAGKNYIENFFQVKNVFKEDAPGCSFSEMYSLFYEYTKLDGTTVDGPFKEFENHVKKYMGSSVSSEMKMDPNGTLITSGGEVTLTYVGKGTDKKNDVGYFYYPKSEEANYLRADGTLDFDKVKKFVLFKDMSNTGDLLKGQNPYYGDDEMVYSTFSYFQQAVSKFKDTDKTYKGTKFKLAYFGDESAPRSTGTYDFPANYVVGFFGVQPESSNNTRIFCSIADVERNYLNDYPRGAVFKFKGNTYLGLEDDADYDINDYLFQLEGFKNEQRIIDITPEPVPDPTPDPEYVSWMFACEDLGNMDDYDFNDIVWEVVNNYNEDGTFKDAKIRILAAGGTLPFTLNYSGQKVCTKDDVYGRNSSATMFNTGQATGAIKEYSFPEGTLTGEWSPTNDASKFSVDITSGTSATSANYTVSLSKAGSAPQIILVPGGWEWPTERQKITSKYSKFADWVNNSSVDWLGNSRSSNSTTQQETTQQETTQQEPTQQETTQQKPTQQEGTQQGTTQQETTQSGKVILDSSTLASIKYDLSDYVKKAGNYEVTIALSEATYVQLGWFGKQYTAGDYYNGSKTFTININADDLDLKIYVNDANDYKKISSVTIEKK